MGDFEKFHIWFTYLAPSVLQNLVLSYLSGLKQFCACDIGNRIGQKL